MRATAQAETKVGHSDVVLPCGRGIAATDKSSPGKQDQSLPIGHIDGEAWRLVTGSSHPGAEGGPKGWVSSPLKRFVS